VTPGGEPVDVISEDAAPRGGPRVAIEGVVPEVDGGRFAIKRTVGDSVTVEADVFTDGHDELAGVLLYRRENTPRWTEDPLMALGNDRWRAVFTVDEVGRYRYTLSAWVDRFGSWVRDLRKRVEAGQDVTADLAIGEAIVRSAGRRAAGADARRLAAYAKRLRSGGRDAVEDALGADLATLMSRYATRDGATVYEHELVVIVDRERARSSAWYEMFPRSCAAEAGRHGTFADAERRLPYVASMGFDVLYLPPIHPIGVTHRKGRNNAETAGPDDPGSPWAIGSHEGGHTAVHPQLGTLADFRRFRDRARDHGLEIALDLAYQCSPDHPYVGEHPQWFRHRPDGTIQYAENPPKKYQDIYPFDFETEDWRTLWVEMRRIVHFWIDQGVRIFRVDNPHTKPFRFWEWLIDDIGREYPDVLFLAEAFTRPRIMYRLAKLGFSHSYTYFAWRNTKAELTEYLTELAESPVREYFRPHFWPNTPDILTGYLQTGGRAAFAVRLVLAATLVANYGIYGPAFELCEHLAAAPGSEEYLNAEKYEIKHWDIDRTDSLRGLIAEVNRIRRDTPALRYDWSLRFHGIDNDQLLCYSKRTPDGSNVVLIVVNLDPAHTQVGWTDLNLDALDCDPARPFAAVDVLGGVSYAWQGRRNYVQLDPRSAPAHIFRIDRGLP
jgi:starch synthase (maltosyl-transferring)